MAEPYRNWSLLAEQRAHRQLIVRRLRIFAAGWSLTTLAWALVLAVTLPSVHVLAGLLFASQLAVLLAVIGICRRDPESARIPWLVVLMLIALGLLSTTIFAAAHAYADVLAFMLLTLYVASALLFAWGAAMEASVLAPTLLGYALALPFLRLGVPSLALLTAIAIGVVVSLAIAEASARAFRSAFSEQESQARYRGIVQSAVALICRVDRAGRITFLNDAYSRMLGKRPDELLGQHVRTVVHEDDMEALREVQRTIEAPSYRGTVECRNRTPSGWVWTSWEVCAVRQEGGAPLEIQAFGRDVSERRLAEEKLRASFEQVQRSEERLRRLAQHQANIREEERKRLGLDLHDDVCQELTGVAILVESLRQRLAPVPAEVAGELDRIMRYLHEVIEHLRGVARDLRPLLLQDLGLEGCLRALADGLTTEETVVLAEFTIPTPRLDEASELSVYRIAQEALVNAVRHAAASTVVMTLSASDGTLRLVVRDDGRGFGHEERARSSCLGLASMEERAVALGASFALQSAPGQGTVVSVACPLAAHVVAVDAT